MKRAQPAERTAPAREEGGVVLYGIAVMAYPLEVDEPESAPRSPDLVLDPLDVPPSEPLHLAA
jgi:hypothetical protein